MKKDLLIVVAVALLLFSCIFYKPQIPGYFYDDGYYKNSQAGFKVRIPDDWVVGTTPKSVPKGYSGLFQSFQTKRSELLIAGVNGNERCGMRCIATANDTTLEAYFKDLFAINESGLTTITAEYFGADSQELIEWSYYTTVGASKYRFIEYLFSSGGLKIRLSFWTISGLFDDYRPVFETTARTIFLAGDPADTTRFWQDTPLYAAKEHAREQRVLAYATDKTHLQDEVFDASLDTMCSNNDKSFLWKVSGGAVPCYLLGSIHLLKPEMYPLKSAINDAFDSSGSLVLELNGSLPENTKKIAAAVKTGVFTGDSTIRQAIAAPLYDSLLRYVEKYGLKAENVLKLKPWMATIVLQQIQMRALGLSVEYGVEQHFNNKKGKREILELETVEEQMGLLASMDGEAFLRYSLQDLDKSEKMMRVMLRAWSCGNLEVLRSIVIDEVPSDQESMLDKILYERNERMARKISSIIKQKKRAFVVVGAAHLLGERSVQNYLKKAGYSVEQL